MAPRSSSLGLKMSLSDWLKRGWLVEHKPNRQEIADLFGVAKRDLDDCQTAGLSPDWKLNIAHNAALQTATVALAACGFRASRQAHHYRVIQSLTYTIGSDATIVTQLDAFRKKRNMADYERAGMVSEQEAKEMIQLAHELRRNVEAWFQREHPELM